MKRSRAVPLADVAGFAAGARRSLVLRAAAVLALAALAATLIAVTRPARSQARAARGRTTVVVLDLSGSIGGSASATIVRTLRTVAAQGGRAGLVLFSDTTEEALPPTAPASLLRSYIRLFSGSSAATVLENPWTNDFSAGTSIGRGLAAARGALARAGITSARVILVSDLADSLQDAPILRDQLAAYARDPSVQLRIAAVPGAERFTLGIYRHALGRHALAIGQPPAESRGGHLPVAALALVLLAALAFAAHELGNAPLAWREART